jgi:uncharacterized protein
MLHFHCGKFLVGGLIFGAGTVLAGGCISGCLFKSGEGNLNSMVALLGVAIGMSTVEYGHLNSFSKWLTTHFLNSDFAKGMISLPAITHIP